MFSRSGRLMRVGGIPIRIDASWLIILALLTLTLMNSFRYLVPGLSAGSYWALGFGTALAFFVCIVLHELGHALTARRLGIPISGITLFLFGGVAEMEGEPDSAGKEFLMAIAGPLVSAVLGGLFWGLAFLSETAGWPRAVVVLFAYLAWINLAVLVFNLVPAFPLDGGRVLRSALWAYSGQLPWATRWAARLGQGFAWVLISLGVVVFVLGDLLGGVWLGLIGLFLNNAARGAYQHLLIRQALQGEPVRRFLTAAVVAVTPELTLRQWLEEYVYRYHHKAYPVVADGELAGIVSTRALERVPREEWDQHTVAEVMNRNVAAFSIAPDTDALQALVKMRRTGYSRLLVREDGRLVGILSLRDLLEFLHLKLDLEGPDNNRRLPPRVRQPSRPAPRETHVSP